MVGDSREPSTHSRVRLISRAVLEHRPRRHLAHAQTVQVVAFDQTFERGGEHRLITGGGVRPVGTGEGDTVTTNNRNAAQLSHEKLPIL